MELREIRLALLHKRAECFERLGLLEHGAEVIDLDADRFLDLLARPTLQQCLGGTRRIRWLAGELECLRAGVRLDSGIRQHVVDQSVFAGLGRSEEHTSELQSLMRISYAVLCLKKK